MAAIQRFTTNMGKRLGLKVSDRYREVAAIRWPHLDVRLYLVRDLIRSAWKNFITYGYFVAK